MSGKKCNLCGLPCDEDAGGNKMGDLGLIDARVRGEYGSDALVDFMEYRFSLCEWCLDWLFDQFKVPMVVTDWDEPYKAVRKDGTPNPPPEPWVPAIKRFSTEPRYDKERVAKIFAEYERRLAARSAVIRRGS